MPPRSRGSPVPNSVHSKSTSNLPTLRALSISSRKSSSNSKDTLQSNSNSAAPSAQPHSPVITSPSESASIEDNLTSTSHSSEEPARAFTLEVSSTSSEEEIDLPPVAPKRPLYTHSSRSYSSLPPQTHPSTLFPPFYNRPPAPLPPSPSLTSLLRPTFSTQNSRPTTPDSSDVDTPSLTPSLTGSASTTLLHPGASLNKSARLAPPSIPRASPKVPTYEYYGFALYLASSAAFLMYLLWAFLPSPFLHQLGIYYYPNRWWALAVPAWLVMGIVYIFVALASYNTGHLTLKLESCENIVDEAGAIACIDVKSRTIVKNGIAPQAGSSTLGLGLPGKKQGVQQGGGRRSGHHSRSASWTRLRTKFDVGEEVEWAELWSIGTDGVMDVPIGGVCEVLYGDGRDFESSTEEYDGPTPQDHG